MGLATFYSWRVFHAPDNRPAGRTGRPQSLAGHSKGFPDLLMLKGARMVVAELKAENGRLGPGQQEWLDAFGVVSEAVADAVTSANDETPIPDWMRAGHAKVEVYLWRPSDWEQIQQVLGDGVVRRHDLDPIEAG